MPMSGDSPRYIKSGITADTPGNFTFGAGVLLKNLQWDAHRKVKTEDTTPQSGKTYYYWYQDHWNTFTGEGGFGIYDYYEEIPGFNYKSATKIGATKDGTTLKIAPEYTDIDIDGVLVKMKQMTVKTGEVATLETTFTENTAENAALALNGDIATQSEIYGAMTTFPTGTQIVKSRSAISVNDYITNLAFIANRIDDGSNRETVVIFKNALCTSGIELATKNKEISTYKMTFECCADLASDVPVKLPFEIIYLDADNA